VTDPAAAGLGRAVARLLDAHGVDVEAGAGPGGAHRVTSASTSWIARPVEWLRSLDAALYELIELPEMTGPRPAAPVIALLPDGASFLLNTVAGFAGFAEAVGVHASADELAHLVAHFWGRGMERVVGAAGALSEAGLGALRGAGAEPVAPRMVRQDGDWELRFLAAAAAGASAGLVAYDLREWTVRRRVGDGVDWQVRPVVLGVAGALR
jgi:hypothetical protein